MVEVPQSAWRGLAERFTFVVEAAHVGERFDQFLTQQHLPVSRTQIKRYLDENHGFINEKPAKPATRLKVGDVVAFTLPEPVSSDLVPETISLTILFEDDDLIVVDKPAGMVVHPAPGHAQGTLVNALLAHCGDLAHVGGELRPGIVHRLDKLTSGVLVISKSDRAHWHLAEQFKEHSVERRYIAIVSGRLKQQSGTFDTLHGRHPVDRKRFSSRQTKGRRAVTHYRVLEWFEGATLVEARLETGRTHQVRVHFCDHGHAVLGDPLYGRAPGNPLAREVAKTLGRQALHAQVLAFNHPVTQSRLRFESALPHDMQLAIRILRGEKAT